MPGHDRLTLRLSCVPKSADSNIHIIGRVSPFEPDGSRTINLADPTNKPLIVHEYAHLFNSLPPVSDLDLISEGFATFAELLIGHQNNLERFLFSWFGASFELHEFTSQAFNDGYILPAQNYNYAPLAGLRYVAAALSWSEVYQQDPSFFTNFNDKMAQWLATAKNGDELKLADFINRCSSANIQTIRQANPILQEPLTGPKLAFAPAKNGNALIACCFNFDPETSLDEQPLAGIPIKCTINNNGETILDGKDIGSTDPYGGIKIFSLPPELTKGGRRLRQEEKTARIQVKISCPYGTQEIILATPPLIFEKS